MRSLAHVKAGFGPRFHLFRGSVEVVGGLGKTGCLVQAAGAAGQTVEAVDPETGEIHEE